MKFQEFMEKLIENDEEVELSLTAANDTVKKWCCTQIIWQLWLTESIEFVETDLSCKSFVWIFHTLPKNLYPTNYLKRFCISQNHVIYVF